MSMLPTGNFVRGGYATGRIAHVSFLSLGVCRVPTDPIGTTTITFTNVIDGSSLQIESQDGSTTLHNSVISGTTKSVTLQVYAPGSPLNALRIKVRKGSVEPFYQPYETLLPAAVGAQSIYVSQIPD